MKINNKHFKLIFLAGIVLGLLPIIFGAPNSKAIAPSVDPPRPQVATAVPREEFIRINVETRPELGQTTTVVPEPAPTEPPYGKCSQWMSVALSVGWVEKEWATVDRVMFRESRCLTDAFNDTDPHGGSWGLMQINGFWCKPSRWTERGFLQDRGVLNSCDELFDPSVNLSAALAIWMYGEETHACGWKGPWLVSCKR